MRPPTIYLIALSSLVVGYGDLGLSSGWNNPDFPKSMHAAGVGYCSIVPYTVVKVAMEENAVGSGVDEG